MNQQDTHSQSPHSDSIMHATTHVFSETATAPSLLIRIGEQVDILLELADQLVEEKAFRTVASLSATSRSFWDMLKPLLERPKKRIVVDVSDLCFLREERYADIQYVHLSRSRMR